MAYLHRNTRINAALLTACALLSLLPTSAQQASSSDSNPVSLLFTAIDKRKQFITTLRAEDIRVLEDGVQQEIIGFKQQTDKPVSIVFMLDMSRSQEKVIPSAKLVSRKFVDSIIHPNRDSVAIISFSDEAKLEQELTGDLQQIRQAINHLKFIPPEGYIGGGQIVTKPTASGAKQQTQGGTAIWDAISFALEKVSIRASDNSRRVIILLTDGHDTVSKLKLSEAVEQAIKANVVVYSIALSDDYYGGTEESQLRKVSERTGGRAFFPKKVKDLQAVFAEIEQELRSQYLISYSSASKKTDNKIRKVKIEIVNPEVRKQGLQLSHQQGYFTKG
jgi:VWFA-related protein